MEVLDFAFCNLLSPERGRGTAAARVHEASALALRVLNSGETRKLLGLQRVFSRPCLVTDSSVLSPTCFCGLRWQSSPSPLPVGLWPLTPGGRCPRDFEAAWLLPRMSLWSAAFAFGSGPASSWMRLEQRKQGLSGWQFIFWTCNGHKTLYKF